VAERTVEQAEDLTLRLRPPQEILTNWIFVFSLMILRSSSRWISLPPTRLGLKGKHGKGRLMPAFP
jgi:hypothetical protein